jgi:hypothetical protein
MTFLLAGHGLFSMAKFGRLMAEMLLLLLHFFLVHLIDLLVTLLKKLTVVIKPGSGCFIFMDWHWYRVSPKPYYSHLCKFVHAMCIIHQYHICANDLQLAGNFLNHSFKSLKLSIINKEWAIYIFVNKVFMLYYTSHLKL